MNASFQRAMADAARLTRAGDLHAATAAIQAALQGQAVAAAPDDVIDVEARERPDAVADVVVDPVDVAPAAGDFIAGRHAGAGGTRDFKLYIPPGAADGTRRPLVVMLHGCTQHPDDFAAGTRMNEAARAQGAYVLYPAQAQKANPQRCWNWFKHNHQQRGRGEPELIAGMVREVLRRHAIDPQRVYVAGLSAGGAMAAILGQAYPELFAAVGVHSGLAAGAARDLPSALAAMKGGAAASAGRTVSPPTIVFHGDQDPTVHPVNGEQVIAACAGTVAPEVEQGHSAGGRRYTRRIHRDGGGRVVGEHWTVHGAGHAWSGGSAAGSYTDTRGPDSSAEMLRFFLAQPGPAVA